MSGPLWTKIVVGCGHGCGLLRRDIVEFLLNNSASLLVHDMVTKRTPLHAAARSGHRDTVQVMLRNIINSTHIDCVDSLGRYGEGREGGGREGWVGGYRSHLLLGAP